jgi:hypothetical protein
MNTCRVTFDELQNDLHSIANTKSAAIEAKEQLSRVQNMARHLLNGNSFIDVRKKYNGAQIVGEIAVEFSFKNIGDMVSEELKDDTLKKIYFNNPGGIFDLQKLIGDCAQKIAFDALNLWGSPFTDFEDLRSASEESL